MILYHHWEQMDTKKNKGNGIIKFYKHWKKHGFKKTMDQLKYNYIMLETPQQILKKQLIGYSGSMVATILCGTIFFIKGSWYITVLFFFTLFIQYAGFKQTLQQFYTINNIETLMEHKEEESEKG